MPGNWKEEGKKKRKGNSSAHLLLEIFNTTFYSLFSSLPVHVVFCDRAPIALLQHCLVEWWWRPELLCLLVALTLGRAASVLWHFTQILAMAMLSEKAHWNSQLWSSIWTILVQFPDAYLFIIKPSHSVTSCLQPSSTEILLLEIRFRLIK